LLPWQEVQEAIPGEPFAAAPCWLAEDQPSGWPPLVPWQRLLLKHPGERLFEGLS
jgi:hypothetical protein